MASSVIFMAVESVACVPEGTFRQAVKKRAFIACPQGAMY